MKYIKRLVEKACIYVLNNFCRPESVVRFYTPKHTNYPTYNTTPGKLPKTPKVYGWFNFHQSERFKRAMRALGVTKKELKLVIHNAEAEEREAWIEAAKQARNYLKNN